MPEGVHPGRAYYLSHPQVRIEPAVPVPDWGLSDVGRARLEAILMRPWLRAVERIVTSDECKARETADCIGAAIGCDVEIAAHMHENDRSSTGFLTPDEFEATADAFFAAPAQSIRGWERAIDAQARIVAAVRAALVGKEGTTTLFVGHGGVGTLLKCAIRGDLIDRRFDQSAEGGHPGGGNVHAFTTDLSRSLCGWQAMEELR